MRETVVPFIAGDGLRCNLIRVQGDRPPTMGPVMLVHGAGVRANLFRPPVPETLVDYLIRHGYDVWLENWRASIDLPPNEWTLDQAALYDHPEAVRTVVRETGADRVKAFVHCQGSCSFVMSAVAGLLPQVDTIVSNAVSLHTRVPLGSRFKLAVVAPVTQRMTAYLDPRWGLHAPTLPAKLVTAMGNLTHRSCDNAVCRQVSFTYGSGDPALWLHANLSDETHGWIAGEFGHVPLSFFRQMGRCVRHGHLVSVDGLRGLPDDYVAAGPMTDARFALIAGARNRCFHPASQAASFAHLERHRPGFHSLHVVPGYGHLDLLLGQNAARDVFPLILSELERRPLRVVRGSAATRIRAPHATETVQ